MARKSRKGSNLYVSKMVILSTAKYAHKRSFRKEVGCYLRTKHLIIRTFNKCFLTVRTCMKNKDGEQKKQQKTNNFSVCQIWNFLSEIGEKKILIFFNGWHLPRISQIRFFLPWSDTFHIHGLQSRPPSPKRAERKVRRRPFREAGSGQNNGTR